MDGIMRIRRGAGDGANTGVAADEGDCVRSGVKRFCCIDPVFGRVAAY